MEFVSLRWHIGCAKVLEQILILRPHEGNQKLVSIITIKRHEILGKQDICIVRSKGITAKEDTYSFFPVEIGAMVQADELKVR